MNIFCIEQGFEQGFAVIATGEYRVREQVVQFFTSQVAAFSAFDFRIDFVNFPIGCFEPKRPGAVAARGEVIHFSVTIEIHIFHITGAPSCIVIRLIRHCFCI